MQIGGQEKDKSNPADAPGRSLYRRMRRFGRVPAETTVLPMTVLLPDGRILIIAGRAQEIQSVLDTEGKESDGRGDKNPR